MADESAPRHLPGLDGIRAIAVGIVVMMHIVFAGPYPHLMPYVIPGEFGVGAFFVLSGFLITHLLLLEEKAHGRISLPGFYERRFRRIQPAALFYLLIIFIMTLFGRLTVYPRDFAACIFFVRNIFGSPQHDDPLYSHQTAHFWSLSVEEQFYLTWPAILFFLRGRKRMFIACCVVIIPMFAQEIDARVSHRAWLHAIAYLLWFHEIQLGCLLALVRDNPVGKRLLLHPRLQHWIVPLLAAGIAVAAQFAPIPTIGKPLIRATCFALIINYLIEGHQSLGDRVLSLKPIVFLGKSSYSIYLWQQLFCWWKIGTPRHFYEKFPNNLIFTLVLATFSYYVIENSFRKRRKKV